MPDRGQFHAVVRRNEAVCREHFRLTLHLDAFPPTAPGQFVQLACRDLSTDDAEPREFEWQPGDRLDVASADLLGPRATLRRPFSLAGRRDLDGGGTEITLIGRVVGVGTDWLSRLTAGHGLSVIGPLGNRFALPPSDGVALLVGGGVGIPPMLYLAQQLAGRRAVAFAGALTRDLLPFTITTDSPAPIDGQAEPLFNIADFARHGVPAVISTDDGSYGQRGYVTQALEAYLERHVASSAQPESSAAGSPASMRPTIYTCGPEPMMRRVADIAARRGLPCQVAVERAMACGMGTCQSCVIKVAKPDPAQPPLAGGTWAYRLACTDGPVFAAADLLW